MRVELRKSIFVFIYIIIFAISFLFLPKIETFRNMSIAGTIIIIILLILNFLYTKKLLTPINIIFLCFILFQYGLPILYAIDPNYSNWYLQQMSTSSLINNNFFSIICIETFAFGLIIAKKKQKEVEVKNNFLSDSNNKMIFSFSKLLLIITGVIAIPLGLYVSYLGIIHGYNYVKMDSMHIYNGITRFAQEFFVAANILCIVFSNNKQSKRTYMILALVYAIILIFSGARTMSLAIILVLVFVKSEDDIKSKAKRTIFIALGIVLLAFIGSMVAEQRLNGNVSNSSIIKTTESVVEEMGFNFTTINFVESFVPSTKNYQYGITYIKSILCLIPKTLDPTNTIENINRTLPEFELSDWLASKYGNLYSFGVGYSVIAEAYYNFGFFGFISVFIQGLIIGKIMGNSNDKNKTKFQKYVEYILLFALLTYPRRSFLTLLKCIEYYIVFIILAIFLISQRNRKIRGNKE